ncbi:hypothetical protein [Streptomyces vastus]|uniref:Uncharacterized protein n=1 Tax=Streptomyces vastus TaxID=285451 RepID=A0ABN3RS92_9ACTN
MTVPQCVNAPDGGWTHGAKTWNRVVVIVTITVIVTACAGLSPEWVTAAATLLTVCGTVSAMPEQR